MPKPTSSSCLMSRRTLLRAVAGAAVAAGVRLSPRPGPIRAAGAASPADHAGDDLHFRALDGKIKDAMARYQIPGVAVGVLYNGCEYMRGYGVTNVDYPLPVDGDTLFRIGSMTKTFTGTATMRLVDQRMINLDAPVRTYLPHFKVADEPVAASVSVRQTLNHSAGWLGDDYLDYGRGDDALADYVAGMRKLLQQRRPEPGGAG